MLFVALSLACEYDEEEPACASFPDAAEASDGTLGSEDDCGFWTLAVGDYLAVGLHLGDDIEGHEDEALCEAVVDDGLSVPYPEGTYTNMSGDGPKWTVQVFGDVPTEMAAVDISCFEGTEWHARVQVE